MIINFQGSDVTEFHIMAREVMFVCKLLSSTNNNEQSNIAAVIRLNVDVFNV